MSAETHELWSWNERYEAWWAQAQGSRAEMEEAQARRYAAARKHEATGSAWMVTPIGKTPGARPDTLGVEIVRFDS